MTSLLASRQRPAEALEPYRRLFRTRDIRSSFTDNARAIPLGQSPSLLAAAAPLHYSLR